MFADVLTLGRLNVPGVGPSTRNRDAKINVLGVNCGKDKKIEKFST